MKWISLLVSCFVVSSHAQSYVGQIGAPPVIVTNGPTFLTAISSFETFGPAIAKWGNDGAISTVRLPLNIDTRIDGFQGVVSGRFVYGSMGMGGGPIRITEHDIASGALLFATNIGDSKSRVGAAAQTGNGGFAGMVYVDSSPVNLIVLDVFYRAPGPTPQWWSTRIQHPSNTGDVFPYQMSAVWFHDRLWVFFCRDSAGQIGLSQFRIEGNALVETFHLAGWIPFFQGPVSPSGEFPTIAAVVDESADRILLAYRSATAFGSLCFGTTLGFSYHVSITEVREDRTYRNIGETPWWTPQAVYALPAIFPQPNGVGYMLDVADVEGDCARSFNSGLLVNGQFITTEALSAGTMISSSSHGWHLFYHRDKNLTELRRFVTRPVVTARIVSGQLRVDWSPAKATDILQVSMNLTDWMEPYVAQLPPIIAPLTGQRLFFRVRSQ